MSEVKKKLCYILPSYNQDTDTHYAYLYPFINKISKQLRVFLVIEKGNRDVSAFRNCESVYIQKFSILPLRIFESFLVVLFVDIDYCCKCFNLSFIKDSDTLGSAFPLEIFIICPTRNLTTVSFPDR